MFENTFPAISIAIAPIGMNNIRAQEDKLVPKTWDGTETYLKKEVKECPDHFPNSYNKEKTQDVHAIWDN